MLLVTGASACEAMAREARAPPGSTRTSSRPSSRARRAAVGRELAGAGAASACGGDGAGSRPVRAGRLRRRGDRVPRPRRRLRRRRPEPGGGAGGRARAREGAPVSACFLDTDGSDGGTDAAGAIVDGHTVARAAAAGIDLAAALAEHRSGEALAGARRPDRHRPDPDQRQRPVRDRGRRRRRRSMSEPMIVARRGQPQLRRAVARSTTSRSRSPRASSSRCSARAAAARRRPCG